MLRAFALPLYVFCMASTLQYVAYNKAIIGSFSAPIHSLSLYVQSFFYACPFGSFFLQLPHRPTHCILPTFPSNPQLVYDTSLPLSSLPGGVLWASHLC